MSCLHARGISDLPMGNGPGLQHGLGDVFRGVIQAFSMSGESRIACLSCLRAMMLRSHRNQCTRQQTLHKPSEFEVVHFILHACVWLHQGFHLNPTFLHGYGQCCRMSDQNQSDDVTSGSNVINPPYTGRQGPTTRQQSTVDAFAQAAAAAAAAQAAANRAQAASQGAQSATASIDYHSLATAMSRLNDDSASNSEKGT